MWLHYDSVMRLLVDDNPEPLKELRRLIDLAAKQRAAMEEYRKKQQSAH